MRKTEVKTKKNGKLSQIISYILIVLSLYIAISSVVGIIKEGVPRAFGLSVHVIVTNSMEPEIMVDDVVFAKSVEKEDVRIGDDIVFRTKDKNLYGMLIVHRVIDIDENGDFITQGVKAGAKVDDYHVEDPIAKVVFVSSFLGKLFKNIIQFRSFIFALLIVSILVFALSVVKSSLTSFKMTESDKDKLKEQAIENMKKELMEEIKQEQSQKGENKK